MKPIIIDLTEGFVVKYVYLAQLLSLNLVKADIITLLQQGDESAFRQIYKEYYTKLYKYVLGYVRNEDDAKDIVQATFIILWNKRATLADNTRIYAWIFTVVRNQCLNHIRNNAYRNLQNEDYFIREERAKWQAYTLESFVPDDIAVSELRHILNLAVEQMPPQCKQVFVLSRFEQLSHKQIAEKLNISPKTVENQITKALHIVRKKLNDFNYFLFLLLFFK